MIIATLTRCDQPHYIQITSMTNALFDHSSKSSHLIRKTHSGHCTVNITNLLCNRFLLKKDHFWLLSFSIIIAFKKDHSQLLSLLRRIILNHYRFQDGSFSIIIAFNRDHYQSLSLSIIIILNHYHSQPLSLSILIINHQSFSILDESNDLSCSKGVLYIVWVWSFSSFFSNI